MVKACNIVGCSNAAMIEVDYSAPTSPTSLILTSTSTSVNLMWDLVADTTYYNISRNGDVINASVLASSTSYEDTLTAGGSYIYTIRACNLLGCSLPISETIHFALITADDLDGDGLPNSNDVDADGDGLIEIYNVTAFNAVRNNLAGTGLDLDGSGSNSTGCGGGVNADGDSITACKGYELMADIDLNDLDLITSGDFQGSNWQPIGGCANSSCTGASQFFAVEFNGNGYDINNLHINTTATRRGIGLFGAIGSNARLSNVHLRNVNITAPNSNNVGGLVGYGQDATIVSSSATIDQLTGGDSAGGLVGRGLRAAISSSSVVIDQLTGNNQNTGGLAGEGQGAVIVSSSAFINQLTGNSISVGGLVGQGQSAAISSSSAIVNQLISNPFYVGGLAGWGISATIKSSLAITLNLTGTNFLGGLAGIVTSATSINSYWDNRTEFVRGQPTNMLGNANSTANLQAPTNITGFTTGSIYETWADAYCNPTTGEYVEATTENPASGFSTDFIQSWDLGGTDEYPVPSCLPNFTPAEQRVVIQAIIDGDSPVAAYNNLPSKQ